MKTAWGREHRRRFALVDGADVLASATQYDLPGVLDKRPVRVCGIGDITQSALGTIGRGCAAKQPSPKKSPADSDHGLLAGPREDGELNAAVLSVEDIGGVALREDDG